MSLDVAKLEKVRELAGGIVQARCPACAEGGNDRTGEHLRIYPDGRFGCCVHPKDGEHRKRIWALAGCKLHLSPAGSVSLRLKSPPALPATQSVTADFASFNSRTPRTPKTESENGVLAVLNTPVDDSRTARTALLKLRAHTRGDSTTANIHTDNSQEKLEDLESAVRSVRTVPTGELLPFLTPGGDLSIPFDSPERYHWWRGGQSVAETLNEVKERMKNAITI
jgi:hypothetical protein